jgi:hypothetical protein
MEKMPPPRPLSALLTDMKTNLAQDRVTVAQILEEFHERGFGFFLFVAALPPALPLPGFGISAVFALPLILLTVQQILGFHTVWVPASLKQKTLSRDSIHKIIDLSLPYVLKGEGFIKPRLGFLTQGVYSHMIGVLGLIMALCSAVPLPLMNTVPTLGIAIMAIGVMMRDGLAVIAGALVGTIWSFFCFFILAYLGTEGLDKLSSYVRSLF